VLLAEALKSGTILEDVYSEPDADPELISRVRAAGVQVTEVAAGSLRKVLDLVTPQSVVAVAEQRHADLRSLLEDAQRRGCPVMTLVGIQDPGNAGTLVRVAEATGCAGVVFTEGSVDPWNPKTVRATAGALLRVPVSEGVAPATLVELAGEVGPPLVATIARGGGTPDGVDLSGANVILVGSEAHGLPAELLEAAQLTVTIPMEGEVESLNAAVSGALLGFEAARQRRAAESVDSSGAALGHNVDPTSPQEHNR
jgi:TrmH family RNA methyltransferase